MANRIINMSKLRQLIRLYSQGESKLNISELTGIARNTVKKYIKLFDEKRLRIEEIESLSDEQLEMLMGLESSILQPERYQKLISLLPEYAKRLKKRNVNRKTLWKEYITQYPNGYKLAQFKRHVRKWLKYTNPVMHIEHKARDKMFIDFTGEKLHILDPQTGEHIAQKIFLSVLGWSQYTYIEAVESQLKEDLIMACENALRFYGGVHRAIVPDNLKSAVKKIDRYEPTLNEAFEDFASHYNTAILPARVYKPKDKALMEGAVKIV
jgi:transposase